MLRSLLVGILAVSTTTSCQGDAVAPTVQPGVAAGRVIEVAGSVTAKRGNDTRVLAQGDEISGDDVITTGSDGRVAIVLSHNNARWDLPANRTQAVSTSLAWTAAKQDRPAAAVQEATAAAGRHAEKSAAETSATALDHAPAASAPSAEPAAAPADERGRAEGAPAGPARIRDRADRPSPRPSPQRTTAEAATAPKNAANLDLSTRSGSGRGGGGASSGGPAGGTGVNPTPKRVGATGGAGGSPSSSSAPTAPTAATVMAEVKLAVANQKHAMIACLDAAPGPVDVTIIVKQGKATITPKQTTPQLTVCLAGVAKGLSFTVIATPVRTTFRLP